MKKLIILLKFVFADFVVLSPAKTGSTFIFNLIKSPSKLHMHCFFKDSIYFYKPKSLLMQMFSRRIERFLFLMLMYILGVKRRIIYIPLRNPEARARSILKDLFVPICNRVYHSDAYRKNCRSQSDAIKYLYSTVNVRGQDEWLHDHFNLNYEDVMNNDGFIKKTFMNWEFFIFDISSFDNKTILLHLDDEKINANNVFRNKSSELWYIKLFDDIEL